MIIVYTLATQILAKGQYQRGNFLDLCASHEGPFRVQLFSFCTQNPDIQQDTYSTAFAILVSASSVPSAMCFFTIPVNIPRKPASLMSQTTSIRVFSPDGLTVTTLVPLSGPSVIEMSTDFFGFRTTVWRHFESLNAIVTSRSIVLPFLLMFLTVLVPCQYSGSLSTSATISHTRSNGAETSRLALMVTISQYSPAGSIFSILL